MAWVYAGAAVVFAVWFAWSVRRDRARPRNPVLLGSLLVSGVLWTVVASSDDLLFETALGVLLLVVVVVVALVVPVAAIANGVVMWRREGHRIANLLAPAAGVGVLGVVAAEVATVGPGTSLWGWAVAAAVLAVSSWLGGSFVATLLYAVLYARTTPTTPVGPIVLLGCGLLGRRVSPLLAGRLDRGMEQGARARAAGWIPVLVVSGGQGPGEEVSEAVAMRGYLLAAGAPDEVILLEKQARTTAENLRLSRDVLVAHGHSGPITAVTNDFHVLRTAFLARAIGVPAVVVGSRTARYFLPSAFLREYVAILALHPVLNGITALSVAALPVVLLLALS